MNAAMLARAEQDAATLLRQAHVSIRSGSQGEQWEYVRDVARALTVGFVLGENALGRPDAAEARRWARVAKLAAHRAKAENERYFAGLAALRAERRTVTTGAR